MNLPNIITLIRIILVPVIVSLVVSRAWGLAFALFVIAGISDALDGFIAKRWGMATELGATIDPLADKALLVSLYVALAFTGDIPAWLAILTVFRDIIIVAAVMVSWSLDKPLEIKPLAVSKVNTAVQIALVALVLMIKAAGIAMPELMNWAFLAVAGLTLMSGGAYLSLWVRHMAE
ncbi:MAG: CDP-alcohol phosphatidyltransferase family protein [Beijerinckiaceae bacterium]